jgi:hypothetical protein
VELIIVVEKTKRKPQQQTGNVGLRVQRFQKPKPKAARLTRYDNTPPPLSKRRTLSHALLPGAQLGSRLCALCDHEAAQDRPRQLVRLLDAARQHEGLGLERLVDALHQVGASLGLLLVHAAEPLAELGHLPGVGLAEPGPVAPRALGAGERRQLLDAHQGLGLESGIVELQRGSDRGVELLHLGQVALGAEEPLDLAPLEALDDGLLGGLEVALQLLEHVPERRVAGRAEDRQHVPQRRAHDAHSDAKVGAGAVRLGVGQAH